MAKVWVLGIVALAVVTAGSIISPGWRATLLSLLIPGLARRWLGWRRLLRIQA
jgi:hypothetical protein